MANIGGGPASREGGRKPIRISCRIYIIVPRDAVIAGRDHDQLALGIDGILQRRILCVAGGRSAQAHVDHLDGRIIRAVANALVNIVVRAPALGIEHLHCQHFAVRDACNSDVIVHVGNERARNVRPMAVIIVGDGIIVDKIPAVHDLAGQVGVRAVHARIHITYHRAGSRVRPDERGGNVQPVPLIAITRIGGHILPVTDRPHGQQV